MVTLASMAGYTGYRPTADFCKTHEATLTQLLSLKHGVPSHVTFRQVLSSLQHDKLISAFHQWMGSADLSGEVLAGDGKALGATVTDSQSKSQDFQAVVSLFSQKTGLVTRISHYANAEKDVGEGNIMRAMLKEIQGKGLLITLDALHTQKKRQT